MLLRGPVYSRGNGLSNRLRDGNWQGTSCPPGGGELSGAGIPHDVDWSELRGGRAGPIRCGPAGTSAPSEFRQGSLARTDARRLGWWRGISPLRPQSSCAPASEAYARCYCPRSRRSSATQHNDRSAATHERACALRRTRNPPCGRFGLPGWSASSWCSPWESPGRHLEGRCSRP